MSGDDGRRLVAVLALLFVVVLTGGPPLSSSGGSGDLTVEVVGEQEGTSLEGKTVSIKNDETGEVVYEASTGPNGQLTTTLEEGEYTVVTGETSDTVEVDADGADIELEVAVSPRKRTRKRGSGQRTLAGVLHAADRLRRLFTRGPVGRLRRSGRA